MVLHRDKNIHEHVEFVDYTGRYPSLCMGVLTLRIDGKEVTFGDISRDTSYSSFWSSGGGLDRDYCPYSGEWKIDYNSLPEQYKQYADEIDEVFNSHVPYGCCGGCA